MDCINPIISLFDMPESIIIYIFSFLPIKSLLSLSNVSKEIGILSENNGLWKPKCDGVKMDISFKNYKNIYHKNIATDWIKSFSSPSYAFCIKTRKPETQCVCIVNHVNTNEPIIYFGATTSRFGENPLYGLYYYPSFPPSHHNLHPKPVLFNNDLKWKYEWVTSMDVHNDKLLVCGTTSCTKTDNILLVDAQNPQNLLSSFKHECKLKNTTNITSNWQNKSVSMVKFADNGNMLYSSSPYEHGVILWDINKQKQLRIFDHRIIDNKLYDENYRNEGEIYSVSPTKNGNYFISGSFSNLYFYDKRMNETNGLIKTINFYSNTDGAFYPLTLTGFIQNESRFVCFGKRPSKIKTFEFPSFNYILNKENDFTFNHFMGELNAIYITSFNIVGCDIYGYSFLWNNFKKGEPLMIRPKGKYFHPGSGYNGCYVNSSCDTIAFSMNNPESGWCGGIGTVFTMRDIHHIHHIHHDEPKEEKNCFIL